MKKSYLLIFLVALIIVFLGWLLFFNEDRPNNVAKENGSRNPVFNIEGGPLGGSVPNDEGAGVPPGDTETGAQERIDLPQLRKLSFKEVSGYGIFGDEGTTTIRFIDRESGNVFETNTRTPKTTRVTNTTILRTNNSWWFDENNFLLRYVDDEDVIKTFLANIPQPSDEGQGKLVELEGTFFENNIFDLSVFGSEIFYLNTTGSGSVGTIYDTKSGNSETVFVTPLQEITPSFYNKDFVAINTRPSSFSKGSLFVVKRSTGLFEEVVGGEEGLYGILPESGSRVLYSKSESSGVSLWLQGPGSVTTKLGQNTLAEKCVWLQDTKLYCAVSKNLSRSDLPDEWYKGNLLFADEIWEINTETGESALVSDPLVESGEQIDVVDIKIDAGGENLFFINKTDGTLWSLSLEKTGVKRGAPESE